MSIEVYPVVHIHSPEQALDQAGLALEMGANGVYLIDHLSKSPDQLTNTFNQAKQAFPENFIGVNYLGFYSAHRTFGYLYGKYAMNVIDQLPDGLWADDAMPERHQNNNFRKDLKVLRKVQYLGGTAFKYTEAYTDNPEFAAFQAEAMSPFVDVVTTSGPGTGSAPPVDKIKAMKEAIGDKPLAVASGISAENLAEYKGFIDKLLVASSIETGKYSGQFVPDKVKQLVDVANA